MNNYIAKLVFCIEVVNEKRKKQYEEKIVLTKADDPETAYGKILEIAHRYEIEFMNENKHQMNWKLIGIPHLGMLENLTGDMELYSEIKEDYNPDDVLILAQRTDYILKNFAGRTA